MQPWTSDELNKINGADELRISPRLKNGAQRKAVPIWVVRVGDDLYVRSAYGRGSGWFRGVQAQHKGRIQAGGVTRDVDFIEENDPQRNQQIDEAYRQKYAKYSATYVDPMVGGEARSATIKLVPQE